VEIGMMSIQERVRAEEELGLKLVQYAGRWVAVEDHDVIADETNLESLLGRRDGQRATARIFQVPTGPASRH